jgi:LPXTG-motif cell wall-anchored protein
MRKLFVIVGLLLLAGAGFLLLRRQRTDWTAASP